MYIADAFVCYVLIIFWIFVLTGCSGFHADTNVFIDTSCAIARSFPVLFMFVVG